MANEDYTQGTLSAFDVAPQNDETLGNKKITISQEAHKGIIRLKTVTRNECKE